MLIKFRSPNGACRHVKNIPLKTFLFENGSLEDLVFHNYLIRKIDIAINLGFIREAIALRQNQ
ncbi:hypothetical protein [Photorhabdus khanii]|uniref:Uncharacterized protein n=1 Tax=Photorhabdus khanii subsp. guanajuatensis TaxID=2100166 RepID=A0A4R4JJR7_9GAMM|nr:hypothetical protein [Photorhabdus khanii]TDB53349.1 hypothetical protein C5467_15400 [Photorhabdus khanii subsp. guanajuatensis]